MLENRPVKSTILTVKGKNDRSANWKAIPAQHWSMLRGPKCWPWLFHSKYALDAKSDQEKHLRTVLSDFSMQKSGTLDKTHILRPTSKDSDLISLG